MTVFTIFALFCTMTALATGETRPLRRPGRSHVEGVIITGGSTSERGNFQHSSGTYTTQDGTELKYASAVRHGLSPIGSGVSSASVSSTVDAVNDGQMNGIVSSVSSNDGGDPAILQREPVVNQRPFRVQVPQYNWWPRFFPYYNLNPFLQSANYNYDWYPRSWFNWW